MKKKINLQFLIMSFTAILLTLVISAAVSYEVLKNEVMEELRTYTHILLETDVFETPETVTYDAKTDGLRITVVAKDGTVEYDSDVNAAEMENHEDRPEVEEAFSKGEGKAIRKSETLDQSMFYYATLLENGCVLRTAKKADNI